MAVLSDRITCIFHTPTLNGQLETKQEFGAANGREEEEKTSSENVLKCSKWLLTCGPTNEIRQSLARPRTAPASAKRRCTVLGQSGRGLSLFSGQK